MNDDIIEIIDDLDETVSPKASAVDSQVLDIEKKVSEAKFDPIEPEKEKITVDETEEPTKNKSGLVLVIVLFIFLAVFIVFLPKITEIFGSLF